METQNLFKDVFDIEGDFSDHAEKLPINQAEANCNQRGKFYTQPKVINSTKELDPEFKLVQQGNVVNLQILFSGKILKSDEFCTYNEFDGSLVVRACTLPCLGRQPCLK